MTASSSTEVPEDFPLVRYWEGVRRGEEFGYQERGQDVVDWWNAREAALARCMKSNGFEFFPRPLHDQAEENEASLAMDRDYLRIPKLPKTRAEVLVVGYGVQFEEPPEPELTDKNQEYVDSLSAGSKSAYYMALDGRDPAAVDYDPYATPEAPSSCTAEVDRAHPEPNHDDRDVLVQHADIISEMVDFTRADRIFADRELVNLNRAWRACMADNGFDPEQPVREGTLWDGPMQAFMRAILTNPEGQVGVPSDSTVLPDEQSRLVGSEAERRIALLDFDCREGTDYLRVFTGVQRAQEEAFVASRRKALDAMLAFVDGLA